MRKILIAIPYLNSGGVEVSLIRFLIELSKNNDNNIDLFMLKKEGMYLKELPKNINIIEASYDDCIYSYERKIGDISKIKGIKQKLKFLNFRIRLRRNLQNNNWPKYYKLLLKHVQNIPGKYDLAIDWHGYGHFITTIVAEKVNARKKVFWIHDEKNEWIDKIIPWLDNFDKIYCVSNSCKKRVLEKFPFLKNKTDIFYNLTDYKNIREKSLEQMDFAYEKDKFNIITVGRLEWQKAYDIAVLIARKLKDKGFNFCWYVIGEGNQKEEIEQLILNNKVVDCFKLLGVKKNPFPYVKNADLYVQTSRHEGFGLAIQEAKILGVVVVSSELECVKEQIFDGKNGFLCCLDPELFAQKILEIAHDKMKLQKIKENLSLENFDNVYEFEKLYNLLEE